MAESVCWSAPYQAGKPEEMRRISYRSHSKAQKLEIMMSRRALGLCPWAAPSSPIPSLPAAAETRARF